MSSPLVSIGMPIYNEERFVRSALESLVEQSYDNFEINIYDNCSTDNTASICEEFAKNYACVNYIQHDENIGAAANFRLAQQNAKGTYFMWAAGHDLWSENLIQECVDALELNSSASIAFATSNWIDEHQTEIRAKQSGWTDTRGMNSVARFYSCLWGNMHPILGLIRQKYLSEAKPIQGIIGADLVVLSELSIKGDFVHAHSANWSRRQFRQEETYTQRVNRYKSKGYNLLDKKLSKSMPALALALELIKVVGRAELPLFTKTLTLLTLFPTMVLKYITSVNN